jgi:hypothetical protein
MAQGRTQLIGPKEEVVAKMTRRMPAVAAPAGSGLRIVPEPGGAM